MRGYQFLAALILTCALSACGSSPPRGAPPRYLNFNPATQAYWTNPNWQAEMFLAVQSVVHLPDDAAIPATSGIHGTVKFLFDNGAIKNPVIIASTGNSDLDKLLLQQVVTAKVPKPIGLHTDRSHEFEFPLDMPTAFESFENNVYAAINQKKIYGRDAVINGHTGSTTVDFDYLDGKAINIVIAKSSGHGDLDQPSAHTVSRAILPAAPPGYEGRALHMEVIVCYSLNSSFNEPTNCPVGKNVIEVTGTRIMRTYTRYY